ncbi:MAG: DUF502 domain-containing protein [Myxococcota bacterium]|jgi:uncharacterized membrane protein|nr:DUF502 domain-containing protein [Myxococcota bacterium]
MKQAVSFFKTTIIGGLVVILPATIIFGVFGWLYGAVTEIIGPITNLLLAKSELRKFLADLIVIGSIILSCFLLGVLVKTSVGRFVQTKLEAKLIRFAPGYKLVKETVLQFLGKKKSPFSQVALVQLYGSDTLATAFITDQHDNGMFSVFVPTGPNPTSGQIFHLQGKYVHPVKTKVEDAMRSIISCGAGSGTIIATCPSLFGGGE